MDMERTEKAEVVDKPTTGESSHDAVKDLRYKILEQMGRWSSDWVSMKTESMKIRGSCSELRRELEELRSQCESTTDMELKGLDEEIQQDGLGLQELFDERARLRKESAKVEAEIKQVEEEIKKKLLGKKVVVIEQEELDYIDRLGTHYRENPEDIRKLSSMNLVSGHLVGALEQDAVEGKLEASQAKPGPSCLEEPSKEVKYLRRNVKKEHEPIDTSEAEFLKKVAEVRRKTKPTEGGDSLKLSFVQVTMKGKKFAALVDTGATHSFLSRKAAKSFGKKTKVEKEWSAFKAVNSTIRVVDGVLKNIQVKVGSWFGKLDLRVVDMDDHSMVLGLDFMELAQAIPMVD